MFENIPVQLSRVIDGSVNKYKFKGVIPNKSKFASFEGPIDWLLKSGLVIKVFIVETPSIPLKSYTKENTFKLYIFDTGLLGCMLDISIDSLLNQDYGRSKGYYAENFVARELAASGQRQLFSWTGRNSEIEFLRIIADEVVPVEVKSGSRTKAKSLAVYRAKYAPATQIKISALNLNKENPAYLNYPLYLAGKI